MCEACVDLLAVSGASVSLAGGAEGARATWWSSDPVAARPAEAQYSLGDGPCRQATALIAPVLAGDLSTEPDARRWPVFAGQAVSLGVHAVFSLPLGSGASVFGALDLYRAAPGALSARDLRLALVAADSIAMALLEVPSGSDSENGVASWVRVAEADHTEVNQATGMIMMYLDLDPPQALARLRAHAFAQDQTLTEAARDGGTVAAPDLEGEAERWPDFTRAAIAAGFHGAYGIPMRVNGQTVGAVGLFVRTGRPRLPEAELRLAQALAAVTGVSVVHWDGDPTRPHDVLTRIQAAVSGKAVIETAKGMIAAYGGIGMDEAAQALLAYSSRSGKRPGDIAHALIQRTIDPATVVHTARSPRKG
ncbi:ANTAR domain-containing protein [Streptomyces sp. YC504]|uniref:ANTAR domain-containing protein n=1 Tax=Streptomyces mesophilus TaxID=1775132 RepID=A0A6G4XDV8_9ACTN|nr:ANTAR domain-containing protein [Streptomyces mesophilus]NGO75578.1 ANTAR domain-containing protein [Streptomyces mesophilus]